MHSFSAGKGFSVDEVIQYTTGAWKQKNKLSKNDQEIVCLLEQDLRETHGKPFGRGWPHLGPLKQYSKDAMHCHLTRDKVAVWRILVQRDGMLKKTVCQFEYLGTRGKAPY